MKKAFLYILNTPNYNKIEKNVPYKIDNEELFFGSCKVYLRQNLYYEFLHEKSPIKNLTDNDYYIIGLNGYNKNKIRKIIFAGKIKTVMTYDYALDNLKNMSKKYLKMLEDSSSPLNVRPIYEDKKLIGLERISELHSSPIYSWVNDIIDSKSNNKCINYIKENKEISINGKCKIRNACLLLNNIFYAEDGGIEIKDKILDIIKSEQKYRNDINAYYIFGKDNRGYAIGLRSRWLEINNYVDELINEIKKQKNIIHLTNKKQKVIIKDFKYTC